MLVHILISMKIHPRVSKKNNLGNQTGSSKAWRMISLTIEPLVHDENWKKLMRKHTFVMIDQRDVIWR